MLSSTSEDTLLQWLEATGLHGVTGPDEANLRVDTPHYRCYLPLLVFLLLIQMYGKEVNDLVAEQAFQEDCMQLMGQQCRLLHDTVRRIILILCRAVVWHASPILACQAHL